MFSPIDLSTSVSARQTRPGMSTPGRVAQLSCSGEMARPVGTASHNTAGRETLMVQCWCRCALVEVPARLVQQGITESCGRKMCNALEFTALAASGDPCDCRDRR